MVSTQLHLSADCGGGSTLDMSGARRRRCIPLRILTSAARRRPLNPDLLKEVTKMRRIISILIALSMAMLTVMYPGFSSNGQRMASGQPNASQDPFQPGHSILHKLPDGVRVGASPEAQAALANLAPEEKQKLRQILNDLVVKAKQDSDRKKHQDDDLPDSLSVSYKDKDGNQKIRTP